MSDALAGDAAQAWLAAIVASSDDAIIGKTTTGEITSWNRGAERLYGYTAAEAIGHPIRLIIPANRRGEEQQILDEVVAGRPVDHYQTERQHKDGRIVPVSLSVSPIRDGSGTIIGAAAIARDITSQVEAQLGLIELIATPILQLRERLLLVPIVGHVSEARTRRLTDMLLTRIPATRATQVIVDLTGMPQVDTGAASRLIAMIESCRLMGADVIVAGISDSIAHTLVRLGIALDDIRIVRDLQAALHDADRAAASVAR